MGKLSESFLSILRALSILFVCPNDEAKKYCGTATRTIDLNGKVVLPGLTNPH